MATNMDKGLYQAPTGLEEELMDDMVGGLDNTPAIEIEIENPDDVTIGMDGVEIDLMPEEGGDLASAPFNDNLAEYIDDNVLASIASELVGQVDSDIQSRKEWVEMYVDGLDVLGMKYEKRTEPWDGACGVYSTVLTEAAVRFQSESIIETFPAQGPVKTQIIGAIDRLKEEAAERVRVDMNYQLTEVMTEYRSEHERLLYNLGLAGAAFKKVYFDPQKRRQTAVFVPAEDIIIPYGASSARDAERVTHVMRKTKNELRKLQATGFYIDVDLGEPTTIHSDIEERKAEDQGYTLTEDERYQFFEIQVELDLPGLESEDGVAYPYVVTIDRASQKVLSIYRNWEEDDEAKEKRDHFVQYTYVPGFGAYGLGLIHLIGGYARAGTALIRQLVDAGTLANLPGGLKTRGLRIKGDDTPIGPGEFRDVDVASGSVRDNIMPLPYKEPSQVLVGLLDRITEEGRRLGSIADMNISDMSANSPVGTTLAILERQLKTMSAVQARIHYAMRQEFKLLKAIIRDNAPSEYDYDPQGADRQVKQSDYDIVEVIPVSDPNSSTMAQRIMQYQAIIQLSQSAPQIYDLPQLHRQMIEVLGVKNADKLVPVEDDMKPRDPVSENMAFLNGEPTKAFIYQDHDAHISVHTSMMQDPLLMAQIGQNPQAQKMMAEIQAHISEHLAFAYRRKIEMQMGVPLPGPNEEMPEQVEVELSRLVAQAAQQVLAQSKGQAQQQQAQQLAQDPIIQMQQKELAIKERETEIKALKTEADIQLKAEELALKARQDAAKSGLDPEMESQRMQQELMQSQEVHAMKMAAEQQKQQIAQQQAQQAMGQQQAAAGQQMRHGGQVHAQKMQHADQAHRHRLLQQTQSNNERKESKT